VVLLASGLLAGVPEGWRHAGIVAVAVLMLLRELGVVRIPLPQNTRQVPQDVLQRHLVSGALQFGFELGTGVRTYVSASAPYVLVAAVLLSGGQLHVALLVGLGFGAGRAATPLARLASGTDEWDDRLATRLTAVKLTAELAIIAVLAVLLY
jgi:hypothetical protein